MHSEPVVVLDPGGVYNPLRQQIDLLVDHFLVRRVATDEVVCRGRHRDKLLPVTLLVLLDVLAVLCVAALVATGRGDSLEEVEPDRSPLGELPAGEIGPEQLRSLRFSIAFRGYRMDQVDAVIERLAVEIEQGNLAARTPDGSHRPAEPEDD